MQKKRLLLCFVLLFMLCSSIHAEPEWIDLSRLSIVELDELEARIQTEKKNATEVSTKAKVTLEADFKNTVEALMPAGTRFSYPFFGLSVVHRRDYYCVCGTVGCRLPDNSKRDLWDATIIYWFNEATNDFVHAAFYTRDTIYYSDDYALGKVFPNIEQVAEDNLKKLGLNIEQYAAAAASVVVKSVPTATPKLTSKPTAKPKKTATPKVTKKPASKSKKTPTPKPAKTTKTSKTKATKTPKPKKTATPSPRPTVKSGNRGEAVEELQKRLLQLNYLYGDAVSGRYDRKTLLAVKDFQVINGLKETGICDEKTWEMLYSWKAKYQETVYKSSSGKSKIYHAWPTCPGLENATEMPLSTAIRRGLQPCTKCH